MKRDYGRNRKTNVNWKEAEKEAAVICQDFSAFCGYIIQNGVKLAPRTGNIGKKDCFAINQLLHGREKYEKAVYLQSRYPLISLFYYVALKYKILETNAAGNKLQQGKNYQCFHEASVWEQYVLFLTTFLFDGTFACEGGYWYTDRVAELWDLYVDRLMEWASAKESGADGAPRKLRVEMDSYLFRLDILAPYLEELALVRVCKKPALEDDGRERWWEIEARPLLEIVSDIYENMEIEREDELSDSGRDAAAKSAYKNYIDRFLQGEEEKLSGIFRDTTASDKAQTIDLQVSVRFTDCVRVIRMNLEDSLYDLHDAIQRAVSFDDDHLFSFTVGVGMMKRTYLHPEAMNRSTDLSAETRLCELNLRKGQKFTYLFDFGDMWQFDICVLEIREGAVDMPEVIRAAGDSPEQYPCYEEDMEFQVQVSEEVQVNDILESIEDDLIREEHAALTGRQTPCENETADMLRREMEKVVLENPDRMFLFMTAGMREMLSELLQMEWIDASARCTLAQLYSFGFCEFSGEDSDTILVPKAIKEAYASKMKSGGKYDKIVETVEAFLEYCGVVEVEVLYAEVKRFLKKKISYDDFEYLVYCRIHYFGDCYSVLFQETKYMSRYDPEMTERILEERGKPENAAFAYPALEQICAEEPGDFQRAVRDWNEYVSYNLSIDWQMEERLMRLIPAMAASGILKKDEILAVYKEMLRGTGSRVTKKADGLIGGLCSSMPLAVRRGNADGKGG